MPTRRLTKQLTSVRPWATMCSTAYSTCITARTRWWQVRDGLSCCALMQWTPTRCRSTYNDMDVLTNVGAMPPWPRSRWRDMMRRWGVETVGTTTALAIQTRRYMCSTTDASSTPTTAITLPTTLRRTTTTGWTADSTGRMWLQELRCGLSINMWSILRQTLMDKRQSGMATRGRMTLTRVRMSLKIRWGIWKGWRHQITNQPRLMS